MYCQCKRLQWFPFTKHRNNNDHRFRILLSNGEMFPCLVGAYIRVYGEYWSSGCLNQCRLCENCQTVHENVEFIVQQTRCGAYIRLKINFYV